MINFFISLLKLILQEFIKFVTAFAVGTSAGAMVCLYMGLPLVLSLFGGFLVMGIALALLTDTFYS